MARFNKITSEVVSELNGRLIKEERLRNEQNSKLISHNADEFIEFMKNGTERLTKSSDIHLMFKGL